jgi:hypothetical protein
MTLLLPLLKLAVELSKIVLISSTTPHHLHRLESPISTTNPAAVGFFSGDGEREDFLQS